MMSSKQDDIKFLEELREHVEKSPRDVSHLQMALRMIDDWIDELKNEDE